MKRRDSVRILDHAIPALRGASLSYPIRLTVFDSAEGRKFAKNRRLQGKLCINSAAHHPIF